MKLQRTLNLIGSIREMANKFIADELEKHGVTGIVPSHGAILMALYNNKSMTMKEIAIGIKRKQPTVTILIDKLVDYGYVVKEKSLDDSRTTNIKLTKKGGEFQSVFLEISHKLNKIINKGLSENESEMLQILLERVLNSW